MNSTVVHNSSKIRTVFALDWSCMELLTSVITCLAFFFVVEREVLEYKYRICSKENVYKPIKTTLIKKFSFVFFFGGGEGSYQSISKSRKFLDELHIVLLSDL